MFKSCLSISLTTILPISHTQDFRCMAGALEYRQRLRYAPHRIGSEVFTSSRSPFGRGLLVCAGTAPRETRALKRDKTEQGNGVFVYLGGLFATFDPSHSRAFKIICVPEALNVSPLPILLHGTIGFLMTRSNPRSSRLYASAFVSTPQLYSTPKMNFICWFVHAPLEYQARSGKNFSRGRYLNLWNANT